MSDAKDILSLIICILAVYTASALFLTGVYFILRKQENDKIDGLGKKWQNMEQVHSHPAYVIESPLPVPETQSAIHPLAQRNAFRRRDVRQRSRSFARGNQSLRDRERHERRTEDCAPYQAR